MAAQVYELSSILLKDGSHYNTTHPARKITLAASNRLLDAIHFNYAWFLGLIFVVVLMTSSYLSVQSTVDTEEPVLLGPGGKPLPRSRRKSKQDREQLKQKGFSSSRQAIFNYLSVALLLTFIAHGCNIIIHALVAKEGWWCGEPMAVSDHP